VFSSLELSRSEVRGNDLRCTKTAYKREFTVLRPISTTGLTAADVGTLAAGMRDRMLDTLRDISTKLEPEDSEGKSASRDPSESGPQIESTIATTLTPGIGNELESLELLKTIPDVTGSFSSLASSSTSYHRRTLGANETGAETQEDDGIILVGGPS
jgi:lysophosphatidate acyltransferase